MDVSASDPAVDIRFVGNATVLLRYGGLSLLTDPNFLHRGQRAYLGYGLTSRRLVEPALPPAEVLQEVDAVILSHLHGDHWDRESRRTLEHSLPILTTPHAARRLRTLHRFRNARGLSSWESYTITRAGVRATVTALPGRHAPGPARLLLPPVMGSLIDLGPVDGQVRQRVYVSGDTLMFDGIDEIARRCPDVYLAVLHLGGTTLPGGLMVTMDAVQGAQVVERVSPRRVLPVHYEEYSVMKSPLADFLEEARRRGFSGRLVDCRRGETVRINPHPSRSAG